MYLRTKNLIKLGGKYMKSLILLSLVSSVASGYAQSLQEHEKSIVDNYNYEFCSENNFEKTNGDEFEILDLEEGGRSGYSSTDSSGNINAEKESNKTERLKPDDTIHNNESAASFEDTREDNDSFQNATNMYRVGRWDAGIYIHSCWLDATISKKTSGWWLWEKSYIDKDFYSFDACTYGTITVTLSNIPANCDYDLRAYRLEDGGSAKASSLDFNKPIASSVWGQNHDEKITLSVQPGCYYFCVYSYQDKTFDNDNPYHLLFEEKVDDSRENTRYSIKEGKENGDIGAIWVSDYKPLGHTPVTLRNSNAKVKFDNYNEYPYIRDLADKYKDGDYINYAVVYVWDLKLKAEISAMAQLLIKKLEEYTKWEDNSKRNVNIGLNGAGLALTVAGTLISIITFPEGEALAIELLALAGVAAGEASFALSLASFVASFQTSPTFNVGKKDLLAYLVSIQQTFAIGQGSNTDEIKILRYRYRFNESDGNRYLDWSPFYVSTDYNFYNKNDITFQIEHSGINGTVKGFKNETEIKNFLEK